MLHDIFTYVDNLGESKVSNTSISKSRVYYWYEQYCSDLKNGPQILEDYFLNFKFY